VDDKNQNIYLVLGCFGRRDEDFISCAGVSNKILIIDERLQHIDEISEYFEGLRLFDRPVFDLNAIRHVLFNMQERYAQGPQPLWRQNKFHLLEKFVLDHRACGNFIRLVVDGPDEIAPSLEQKVRIPGTPQSLVPLTEPTRFELKMVRNRR